MATVVKRAVEYPDPIASWWSGRRLGFVLALVLLASFYSVSWHLATVDPGRLLTGLPKMAGWAAKAWHPATDEFPVLLLRVAETIAMAAIGTTAAALLALPLCVVAARNVTPSLALYYPARWFLNALRGVDSFVFALLFVAAVGLGPFAGVLRHRAAHLGQHGQAVGGGDREHSAGPARGRGGDRRVARESDRQCASARRGAEHGVGWGSSGGSSTCAPPPSSAWWAPAASARS
jgi:hypothetical protein